MVFELKVEVKEQICPFGRGEFYFSVSQKVTNFSTGETALAGWIPARYLAVDLEGRILLDQKVASFSFMDSERIPLGTRELIIQLDHFKTIRLDLN